MMDLSICFNDAGLSDTFWTWCSLFPLMSDVILPKFCGQLSWIELVFWSPRTWWPDVIHLTGEMSEPYMQPWQRWDILQRQTGGQPTSTNKSNRVRTLRFSFERCLWLLWHWHRKRRKHQTSFNYMAILQKAVRKGHVNRRSVAGVAHWILKLTAWQGSGNLWKSPWWQNRQGLLVGGSVAGSDNMWQQAKVGCEWYHGDLMNFASRYLHRPDSLNVKRVILRDGEQMNIVT